MAIHINIAAKIIGSMTLSAKSSQFLSASWAAISIKVAVLLWLTIAMPSVAQESTEDASVAVPETLLSQEVEDLKKAALQLNRDLLILEEELLFPANTQISIFLSLDIGQFFRLDSVKVKIDDKLVASHLYTERQNHALSKGGIQRLYLGNVKTGEHELTAIFTGMGPDNREYKRGATMKLVKDDDPKMLEVRVYDSNNNMQPEFDFKEWEL